MPGGRARDDRAVLRRRLRGPGQRPIWWEYDKPGKNGAVMADQPQQPRILVVEDEPDMARILEYNLLRAGNRPVTVGNCRTALSRVRGKPPDLILLDLRLPDMSGIEILEKLKGEESTAGIPVIVVSALGDEDTVVRALNLGADDYVVKPFRTRELLARVSAALRRARRPAEKETESERISCGPVVLDRVRFEAVVSGEPVSLTRTEFTLLAFMASQPGRVFTRQQLCDQALDAAGFIQERTIDAHVRTLRKKLGAAGACIVTVWGVGYRFNPDAVDEGATAGDGGPATGVPDRR